jgi:plastocyanin
LLRKYVLIGNIFKAGEYAVSLMNKYIASSGVILLLLAAFFFFADFNGGTVGSLNVTGGYPIASFAAFLFVLLFLPIGAGLAFAGFAYRGPRTYSTTTTPGSTVAVVPAGSSGVAKAALAVAIIAILVSAGTLAAVIAVSGQVSTLSSSKGSSSGGATVSSSSGPAAAVNATPARDFYRIDWCNSDPTGQDRFCPSQIVVNQGDTVIILFEHNDTDAHTFTITSGYSFQINATFGMSGYTKINGSILANGMHNFVTNTNYTGSCVNTSTFSQQSAGVSGSLCVSGSNLLSGSTVGPVEFVNPTPGLPLNASAPNGGLVQLNDSNSVVFLEPGGNMSIAYANGLGLSCTASACTNPETGAPAAGETWGIAAFQATTPGTFEYFCHYHVSNGMFGYITVLPNAYCTSSPSACGVSNSTST